MIRTFGALLLCLLAAGPAAAEVQLTYVQWHLLPSQKAGRKKAERIEKIVRPPSDAAGEPLGAVVVVSNQSTKSDVGVLLRYAVSARLSPIGQGENGGIWEVPFWIEEVRIPQVKVGKEVRFTIRNLHLEIHLKKLLREGYWPTALRIQVMAEPKTGEDLDKKIVEAELPVEWIRK